MDIYIVDQTGATFWFYDRAEAERFLIEEAWKGAVHLRIGQAILPNDIDVLDIQTINEWAVQNAPDSGCGQ